MNATECKGCGAPLVAGSASCEYCRRAIVAVPEPLSIDPTRWKAAQRYETGFTDFRAVYEDKATKSLRVMASNGEYIIPREVVEDAPPKAFSRMLAAAMGGSTRSTGPK